ncbi:MAG TPA: thiol reductase thioredoxin [Deltaproteobacteria bacterium]|nr:thiol reductase thioredoxin [Deltaproteobacteria bacterium]
MATHTITADNIEASIRDNDIVILDFWASWCGPCMRFAPAFEASSEAHEDVFFGKIDTEDQRPLSQELGIRSIPTLMVFRENILVFREAGALPPAALEELITEVKKLDMDEVRSKIAEAEAAEAAES